MTRCVVIFRAFTCYLQADAPLDQLFDAIFVIEFPMLSWVCQWKPFWIAVGDSFKKSPLGGVHFHRRRLFRQHCMCGRVACVFPCKFQVMTRRSKQVPKIELIMHKGVPGELKIINNIIHGACRVDVHK